jgi:acyl transferase domain-containing protein
VAPRQVSYVEAHGTGTALGDPIEIQALVEAIGAGGREQKCAVGSAKTNIGHLESAAGIAGLIKVVLMMQEREIPPHLHVKQLNPRLKGEELPVFVPSARQKWEPAAGTWRIAGVSSFGFGGANAHAVLEEAAPVPPPQHASERPLHLLALSGRNEAALRDLAVRYQRHLADRHAARAADVCFTANAGRTHFAHRLSVIGAGVEELRAGLAAFVEGRAVPGLYRGALAENTPPKIAFSFSGTAPQAPGAGYELYRTQPAFRDSLDRCDQLMRAHLPRSLLDAMFRDEDSMQQASYAQPALFALQCAIAGLWRSWGIEPSVLYGEGAGECAAAWCAGVFDLADGLRLAAARGRAMQARLEGAAWDELDNAARNLRYRRPRLPLSFGACGARAGEEAVTPAYWCAQARAAAHPVEGTGATGDRLAEVNLEIGPDPARTGDWSSLLERLGALYVRGAAIDWAGFDRDYPRRRVVLPTYPFQRQRHWLAPSAAQASQSAPARPPLPREEPATE